MKKLSIIFIIFLGIQSQSILAMDPPDWKPSRPSGSGKPRPTAIHFGTSPLTQQAPESFANPLHESTDSSADDAALSFYMNPVPAAATQTTHPMHIINTQTPAQPQVTNPMHIITTTPAPTTTTPQLAGMSDKERARIGKLDKDLDKIEKSLKEMGWNFGEGALSAAGFDPIGTVGGVATGLYNLGKSTALFARVMYTSQKLSKGSPAAKAARDARLPRISKINNAIEKLKNKFSSSNSSSSSSKPVKG